MEENRKRARGDEENEEEEVEVRPPLTRSHKLSKDPNKHHLLIVITGSVAVLKTPELIQKLYEKCGENRLAIKIVATENAVKFVNILKLDFDDFVYEDKDEWSMWRERGDPVLHIELRKWADSMLIAPLDANTMAKIATGICDNLATSLIRAWDLSKPAYFAPAMNTFMWENPLTIGHRNTLKTLLQFKEICPISKELMCGDSGQGAMADILSITSLISALVRDQLAVKTHCIS
ncbi:unnamed protein product [Caenorhabditis angaria]|uniref:Flavoprotein domain-containing protein n=1 Tax=Caenorhabditis angaria TaxID=860376 RepID=A0A9P1IY82_9PELO|nr:unnamed protein product [Caenorhabditis angaria]